MLGEVRKCERVIIHVDFEVATQQVGLKMFDGPLHGQKLEFCAMIWPPHRVMPCSQRQQDGTFHQTASGTTWPLVQVSKHPFQAGIPCWGLHKP